MSVHAAIDQGRRAMLVAQRANIADRLDRVGNDYAAALSRELRLIDAAIADLGAESTQSLEDEIAAKRAAKAAARATSA